MQLTGAVKVFIHETDGLLNAILREESLGEFEEKAAGFGVDFDVGDEIGVGLTGGEHFGEFVYLAADQYQLFRGGDDGCRNGRFLLCVGMFPKSRDKGYEG